MTFAYSAAAEERYSTYLAPVLPVKFLEISATWRELSVEKLVRRFPCRKENLGVGRAALRVGS